MEKVTVKLGSYELEINEDFLAAYREMKYFSECWRNSLDDIQALITDLGSKSDDTYDYKHLFELLVDIRDIRAQISALTKAKILDNGGEV